MAPVSADASPSPPNPQPPAASPTPEASSNTTPPPEPPSSAWFAPDRRFFTSVSFEGVYSSTGISPVFGGKAQFNAYLHERIQFFSAGALLAVGGDLYPWGDFRLRFWGNDAGSWYPALSFDIGYTVRIGDWFVPGRPDNVVHMPLFGGRITFPIDRPHFSRVYADWAAGYNGSSWFLVYYCGVDWRLTGPLGARIQGDILVRPGGYKYTGWNIGPYLEW